MRIDIEAGDEKALLARIAVMYAVVAAVNLASRFERIRWRQAVEREQALQRERVELSQAIHDTAAQSAYMIGLGIDSAKALAGDENQELTATLEATSQLSRSIIWELRHPINVGGIYEGRELSRALRSHATSFHERHLRARKDDSHGSRTAAVNRGQKPALLDRTQRTH